MESIRAAVRFLIDSEKSLRCPDPPSRCLEPPITASTGLKGAGKHTHPEAGRRCIEPPITASTGLKGAGKHTHPEAGRSNPSVCLELSGLPGLSCEAGRGAGRAS